MRGVADAERATGLALAARSRATRGDAGDLAEEAFRAAAAAGLALRELRPEASSLEEIFARITTGRATDPMRERPAPIARRELAAYFHLAGRPGAIAALFLTLQGLAASGCSSSSSARPDAPPGGVMEFFFGGTILFWIAVALLATVIPMRLVAEERRTGTIEPLLTAPVTATDVVARQVARRRSASTPRSGRRRCSTSSILRAHRARRPMPGPIAAGLSRDDADRRRRRWRSGCWPRR